MPFGDQRTYVSVQRYKQNVTKRYWIQYAWPHGHHILKMNGWTHRSLLYFNRLLDIISKYACSFPRVIDYAVLITTVRILHPVTQIPLKTIDQISNQYPNLNMRYCIAGLDYTQSEQFWRITTHKIFKGLLLRSFPLITDWHVPTEMRHFLLEPKNNTSVDI